MVSGCYNARIFGPESSVAGEDTAITNDHRARAGIEKAEGGVSLKRGRIVAYISFRITRSVGSVVVGVNFLHKK